MKATIRHYIDAASRRPLSKEQGGFSLIELIVVVAILGILVAIAIPVFSGIDTTAKENALKAAAANGATEVSAQLAAGAAAVVPKSDKSITLSFKGGTPTTIGAVCITASYSPAGGVAAQTAGPGCTP